MAEREIEPAEILKRTRVEVIPYLRELREHSRAIIPRIGLVEKWIKYYEDISKIRRLTPKESRVLDAHRKTLAFYQARLEMMRAMGRYARSKKPVDLLKMRQSQARYYEAKAVTLPREKMEEIRKEILPPPDLYEKWRVLTEEIEEKCKRYKEAKYRTTIATALMSPTERYLRMRSLGEALRTAYAEAAETAERGKELPELSREWVGLKGK